jgi:hypothetical protein
MAAADNHCTPGGTHRRRRAPRAVTTAAEVPAAAVATSGRRGMAAWASDTKVGPAEGTESSLHNLSGLFGPRLPVVQQPGARLRPFRGVGGEHCDCDVPMAQVRGPGRSATGRQRCLCGTPMHARVWWPRGRCPDLSIGSSGGGTQEELGSEPEGSKLATLPTAASTAKEFGSKPDPRGGSSIPPWVTPEKGRTTSPTARQ